MNPDTPIYILSQPMPSKKEKNAVGQILGLAIMAGAGYLFYRAITDSSESRAAQEQKTTPVYPYTN